MRTVAGDTGDLATSIQSGGTESEEEDSTMEVEAISFPLAAESETTPVVVEEEDSVGDKVEDFLEEVVEVDSPVGDEVEDSLEEVGVVAAVVGLVSEADLRREGRTGDAETVASATILTGWSVTSVRPPSQMSLSLHRQTR